jgi:hypothetical protein
MIEITVKVNPYGDTSLTREIAKAIIGNISHGTPSVCDYQVTLEDDRGMKDTFGVTDIYRDADVWNFIADVLQQRPERPKTPIIDHTTKLYDPKFHPNRVEHEKKR